MSTFRERLAVSKEELADKVIAKQERQAFNHARTLLGGQSEKIDIAKEALDIMMNRIDYPIFEIVEKQREIKAREEAMKAALNQLNNDFPKFKLGDF